VENHATMQKYIAAFKRLSRIVKEYKLSTKMMNRYVVVKYKNKMKLNLTVQICNPDSPFVSLE
jgi:ribosome recycling factor